MLLIYAVEAFGWITERVGRYFLARKRAKNIRLLYYRAVNAAEVAKKRPSNQREYLSLMN